MSGVWTAVVDVARARGPVEERRSRYADKPALCLHGREIAHCEAPGLVDLRITASGWRALPDALRADPRVVRDPKRRDWIELRLASECDAEELEPLIIAALTANS